MKRGIEMFKGRKTKGLIILAGIIAAVAIFLIWKFEAWELFSINYLRSFTGRIRDLKALGVILYLLVFAVSVILFMPSLPFTLLGGITYGIGWGIVIATCGDFFGSAMAFIIGRYFAKEKIEDKLKKNKAFQEINEGVQKEGWRIVAITRMVPIIPHWFQNYAYGVTEISFRTYALVCFLSILPGTAVWVFTINTIGRGQEDARRSMLYLALATVAIVGISYIPKYIYKKKHMKT